VGGIVGALLSIPVLAFSKSFVQDLSSMHDDVLPTGELKV
jgi:predicted PurR-regulated permease PerM